MQYRKLPHGGEQIGVLGLGSSAIGQAGDKEIEATVAMALDDRALSIDAPILKEQDKLAIVLGTEGDGLAHDTIAACEYTACIPMQHGVDSLNVAAASAVAFWELRYRR